jgi:type IV pilus assembly protein PilM
LPLSQQLGWIGVDIGTHTVKLAQAVRDGSGGVRLHRAAVIQRPTSWSSDDALALEQPITSCFEIRAALECGGFHGKDALCSLPMNVCQLRCLNVPPGTDAERRTIIGGELAEDWSALRQPMEFDFWEMESARDKSTDAYNVSVLATSRLWVSQLWRDCRKSGLDCWAIDGVPLTMARAIGLVGGATGGRRVLAVDWGYSNTTLCVVGDERPMYCRRVQNCGFGRVLDGIMGAFDVTLDEAQYLTDTQGFASATTERSSDEATQAAITQAAEAPLDELVRQVRRTLAFTEVQRRHLQPAAVWLMGGGASMRNVAEYLSELIALPVHVWTLPVAEAPIDCAAGSRAAVFSGAATLSSAVWRAA